MSGVIPLPALVAHFRAVGHIRLWFWEDPVPSANNYFYVINGNDIVLAHWWGGGPDWRLASGPPTVSPLSTLPTVTTVTELSDSSDVFNVQVRFDC